MQVGGNWPIPAPVSKTLRRERGLPRGFSLAPGGVNPESDADSGRKGGGFEAN